MTATNQERLGFNPTQIVGSASWSTEEAYLLARIAEVLEGFFSDDAAIDNKFEVTVTTPIAESTINVAPATDRIGVTQDKRVVRVTNGRSEGGPAGDCAGVPFPNSGATPYYVGLQVSKIPASANYGEDTTAIYQTWKDSVGDVGAPDAVVDSAGDLVFTITNLVGGAWVGADVRTVTIWKVNPASGETSVAIQQVQASLSGGAIKAQVSGWLGQTGAPSTTAADYLVHVHGPTITTTNISDGEPDLLYLGVVSAGTPVTSGQRLTYNHAVTNLNLQQLAQDLYGGDPAWSLDGDGNPNLTNPLMYRARQLDVNREALQAVAPKGAIGFDTISEYDAFASGLTRTGPSGGNYTFTFDEYATMNWLLSRDASGKPQIATAWRTSPSNGWEVDFPEAAGADTYVIYALIEPESYDDETNKRNVAYLAYSTAAAQPAGTLRLYVFAWSGSTFTTEGPCHLLALSNPFPGRLGTKLDTGEPGGVQTGRTLVPDDLTNGQVTYPPARFHERITGVAGLTRVLEYLIPIGEAHSLSGEANKFLTKYFGNFPGAGSGEQGKYLALHGPSGNVPLDDSPDERVALILGGAAGYDWALIGRNTAAGTKDGRRIALAPAADWTKEHAYLQQSGGRGSATIDGQRAVLAVADLGFVNSRFVDYPISPSDAMTDAGAPWSSQIGNYPHWLSAATSNLLSVNIGPLPAPYSSHGGAVGDYRIIQVVLHFQSADDGHVVACTAYRHDRTAPGTPGAISSTVNATISSGKATATIAIATGSNEHLVDGKYDYFVYLNHTTYVGGTGVRFIGGYRTVEHLFFG